MPLLWTACETLGSLIEKWPPASLLTLLSDGWPGFPSRLACMHSQIQRPGAFPRAEGPKGQGTDWLCRTELGIGHLHSTIWYSCLENCIDRGAWQAAVQGVTKSQTQLTTAHIHITITPKHLLFCLLLIHYFIQCFRSFIMFYELCQMLGIYTKIKNIPLWISYTGLSIIFFYFLNLNLFILIGG